MLSSYNCIIQSSVDIESRKFLREFSKINDTSVANISGAIIRKFIYEYSKGVNNHNDIKKFVVVKK